jgi:starch phosphorylase
MAMQTQDKERMTGDTRDFVESIRYHIRYSHGRQWGKSTLEEKLNAVALATRDILVDRFLETELRRDRNDAKCMYFLSMEFLIGRSLANNLYNLGIYEICKDALAQMSVDLEELLECERDAALGNGGLGRLAACFLDSLATLGLPGYGYGINYEYGLFRQDIDNGFQKEKPDRWLGKESPWLLERPDEATLVPIYGRIEHSRDRDGNYNPMWMDWKIVIGVPHDLFVPGYGGSTVNALRLFSARASDEFDIGIFNEGDYVRAVEQKISSETLSKVLYPSDSAAEGKELRLAQEYFLVACSMRDIVRRYMEGRESISDFPNKVAIQLNDTHPALVVAELMRMLVDEHDLTWETAWEITQATLGYTNHTLLPEALEKWPVPLLEHVLPRHLQIIYEINHRFLKEAAALWPEDISRLSRMSIIEEGETKQVRMAHLSIIGSHSVNGVANLHTKLLKETLFKDFHQLWPDRFSNKTNGVTQRRWLLGANPGLSRLLTTAAGREWVTDLDALRRVEEYAGDDGFQNEFLKVKRHNKEVLTKIIWDTTKIRVDPASLFDVQVKRVHEYKRQLLNLMHIIHQYLSIIEDGDEAIVPRTYIFGGKAAPGYLAAKLIIKMINCVGGLVNKDSRVKGTIKVVFIPDYRVSLAEKIIPAAELSEQISTAGMEASGTGNMKLAMNGALTIGTMDGATIEMAEEIGEENMFIFGLTAHEIEGMRDSGSYNPWEYYERSHWIKRVMDAMSADKFCPEEPGLFRPIYEKLLNGGDQYYHLADFEAYTRMQEKVAQEFTEPSAWAKKAIMNVARSGRFSSDRTIKEYAEEIWNIKAVSGIEDSG